MSSIDSSIDACYGKYRKIEDMEGMVVDLVESFILLEDLYNLMNTLL